MERLRILIFSDDIEDEKLLEGSKFSSDIGASVVEDECPNLSKMEPVEHIEALLRQTCFSSFQRN